eukprot:m51a1_g14556 putative condensin complex subunit 3 (1313) ;mRNA; r:1017959-1022642
MPRARRRDSADAISQSVAALFADDAAPASGYAALWARDASACTSAWRSCVDAALAAPGAPSATAHAARRAAQLALSGPGDSLACALEHLRARLGAPDAKARESGGRAPDAAAALLESAAARARADVRAPVREACVRALASSPCPLALGAAVDALCDSARGVRAAALAALRSRPGSLSEPLVAAAVVSRVRDVDARVRDAACSMLCGAGSAVPVAQRLELARAALVGAPGELQALFAALARKHWLRRSRGADEGLTELLRELGPAANEDVLADLAGRLLADLSLDPSFFTKQLASLDDAVALAWRVFVEYRASQGKEMLYECLPSVKEFCDVLRDRCARKPGRTPFVGKQLLLIAPHLDLTDEGGRREIISTATSFISTPAIHRCLVSTAVLPLSCAVLNSGELCRIVAESISELRDPLDESVKERDDRALCSEEREMSATLPMMSDEREALEAEASMPDEEYRAHDTALRALRAAEGLLSWGPAVVEVAGSTAGPLAADPTLHELFAEVVVPAVGSPDPSVRVLGVTCFGLACSLSQELAMEHYPLLAQIVENDQTGIRIVALKAIVDCLVVFGLEGFRRGEAARGTRSAALSLLLKIARDRTVPRSFQLAVTEGLSRLCFTDTFRSVKIMTELALTLGGQHVAKCKSNGSETSEDDEDSAPAVLDVLRGSKNCTPRSIESVLRHLTVDVLRWVWQSRSADLAEVLRLVDPRTHSRAHLETCLRLAHRTLQCVDDDRIAEFASRVAFVLAALPAPPPVPVPPPPVANEEPVPVVADPCPSPSLSQQLAKEERERIERERSKREEERRRAEAAAEAAAAALREVPKTPASPVALLDGEKPSARKKRMREEARAERDRAAIEQQKKYFAELETFELEGLTPRKKHRQSPAQGPSAAQLPSPALSSGDVPCSQSVAAPVVDGPKSDKQSRRVRFAETTAGPEAETAAALVAPVSEEKRRKTDWLKSRIAKLYSPKTAPADKGAPRPEASAARPAPAGVSPPASPLIRVRSEEAKTKAPISPTQQQSSSPEGLPAQAPTTPMSAAHKSRLARTKTPISPTQQQSSSPEVPPAQAPTPSVALKSRLMVRPPPEAAQKTATTTTAKATQATKHEDQREREPERNDEVSPLMSPMPSPPQATQKNRPVVVAFTGFTKEERGLQLELAEKAQALGGRVISDDTLDATVTHMVAHASRRTPKTIAGALCGYWIVTPTWILESSLAGQFVEESKYGTKYHRRKPFKGKLFFLASGLREGSAQTLSHCKLFITLGGGRVTEDKLAADYCLVGEEEDASALPGFKFTARQFFDFIQPPTAVSLL